MSIKQFSAPPPIAKQQNLSRQFHNKFTNTDPYAWLRAENWQDVLKNPACLPAEIYQYLEAENQYFHLFIDSEKASQEALFEEMKARIKEEDESIPEKHGAFYYGYAFKKNAQHPNFFRSKTIDGAKEFYLYGDVEAEGETYFQLGAVVHSPDHQKFLFSFDNKGAEFYQISIRDFATKQNLSDKLENAGPHLVWDAKSEGFFYTLLDENHRPTKVCYHKLGTAQTEDSLIYEETNPGYFLSLQGSKLHDYIFINIHDHETSEVWILDAQNPFDQNGLAQLTCVKEREKGIEYSLVEGKTVFYILTNYQNAKDFKIMQAPIDKPQPSHWQEVIPHEEGHLILSIDAFENHLVWLERYEGLPRLFIMNRQTGKQYDINFEEEAYSLSLIGAAEYDSQEIRFSYSSLTTPKQLFSYNMVDGSRSLLKTQIVPSGHNEKDYISKRLYASAPDDERIPISLYYHKDTKIDGTAPCLLYGYGAYGMSIPASFNTNTLSLVNRGFIYAIAHIRGGKEKGTAWYEKGKYQYKTNSFKDFISAARHLVAQNYTQHSRLVAYGGSAGGMLMGAVANMAPQDFGAIVALVPFVDVLNTMLDDSLPLTPPEWPEWGNPLENEEDYQLIASYSPYDNIKAQNYPAILAMAGLTDPRVTYWEAAKWIAKLRAYKTNDTLIFLKTNMESGHGGASGRFTKLKETALIYSYILKLQNNS